MVLGGVGNLLRGGGCRVGSLFGPDGCSARGGVADGYAEEGGGVAFGEEGPAIAWGEVGIFSCSEMGCVIGRGVVWNK